jgi:chromatin remodeling complex protein RSC6
MPETKRVRRVASKPEESASAPVAVAPVAVAAAAAVPATPVKKVKKEAQAQAVEAVAVPAPVASSGAGNERVEASADASAAPAPVSDVEALSARLTAELESFRAYKQTLSDLAKEMTARMETLVKDAQRVLKKAGKGRRRRAPAEGATSTRKPTGFHSPMSVTEELCTFLSKPAGTKFSRTDVTNEINAYIRANNLQNPEDKRQIIPDARLRTLLRLTPDQTLTYFNLQKAFNHLFVKKEDATTSSA